MIQIGRQYQLKKPTFLYKGFFVIQGSQVKPVESADDGSFIVEYLDKEGGIHRIPGIKPEELE